MRRDPRDEHPAVTTARHLRATADTWPDLVRALTPAPRQPGAGRVSGTSGRPLPINVQVHDVMADIAEWTAFWARLLRDESRAPIHVRDVTIESAPEVLQTPYRGLTQHLDVTERGLAMDATQEPLDLDQHQIDRFWSRVDKTGQCWQWTGTIKPNGYGKHSIGRRYFNAHRVAYELDRGPIPPGLDLDHLCRVRSCVNPDHLEPVTRRTNLLRGDTLVAALAARTTCNHGHAFDGFHASTGTRYCKTCHAESMRRQRAAKRERDSRAMTPDLLRLLADHTGFFLEHPDPLIGQAFTDEVEDVRRRAERTAHPTGARRIPVHVNCLEASCPGAYTVLLQPDRDWRIPDLICDKDGEHRITPAEWQRLERRRPADPSAARELLARVRGSVA